MRSRIMDLCALGLLVPLLPACGSDGAPGANGSDGASALVSVVDEPVGDNCGSAGKKIEYGADKSGDGKLDPDEIEGTQYLCNGADGAIGTVGPSGAIGPAGETGAGVMGAMGLAGDTGPAGNTGPAGDTGPAGPAGDTGPAGTTGPAGPAGPAGTTGPAGPAGDTGHMGDTGPAGPTGDTGATGHDSLINTAVEAAGFNCAAGGVRFTVGIDNGDGSGTADNGVLDTDEIDQTSYLCTGYSPKRVFVSSTTTNGNLGGLAGADAICQTAADAASLGGSYKAWISDSTGSPSTRFSHASVPYALVDGTPIAINWAGLISGNLLRPIDLTEANVAYQDYIYTATNPNGTYFGTFACLDWTSSSPNDGALVGYSPDSNQWSYVGIINCSDPQSLYCFEQ